jgi:hypothetical protein
MKEKTMSIKEQLAQPFSKSVEKTLRKGNTNLTYIPVSEIITRLNEVFDVGFWGYRINSCKRDEIDTDFIIAHVTLYIYSGNSIETAQIDGIGGQKINRNRNGEIIELGDDMKGAVSDALKKAAQALGVGLYLARSEEPVRHETKSYDTTPNNDSAITDAQEKTLRNLFKQLYGAELPAETVASQLLKREVTELSSLTRGEASKLIGQAIQERKELGQ